MVGLWQFSRSAVDGSLRNASSSSSSSATNDHFCAAFDWTHVTSVAVDNNASDYSGHDYD
jgi:hypothetical protein